MEITRFNPHAMDDSQVRLLSTGRDRLVETVAQTLTEGEGVRQHVLVTAPRGFGKSFFARAVQVAIADASRPARVTILPEEQRNVSTPSSFLKEVSRGLVCGPAASVAGLFLDDPPGAWDAARTELNAVLNNFPPGELQIVVVENFDALMADVFAAPEDQSRLRAFLSESERLAVLATATSAGVDQDYEQRLFHNFMKFPLAPWSEDDHLLYFERRAVLEGRDVGELDRGKIRALANFTGGAPRMAVALANLLFENDPLSAAQLLDKLVDDLTPYYQALIEQMPMRTKTLFDALIRLGEPCSQSDLAVRVGTTQNRIAQHFAWLRERHLVIGRKRTGGRDYLYQVSDRLFVQYYRKRHLLHDQYSPLAGMAELLDGFFSAEENRNQAQALLADGRNAEAGEFIRAYVGADKSVLGSWAARTNNSAAIMAIGLLDQGQARQALPVFQRALVEARRAEDETGVALLLGQSGLAAAKVGEYGGAIAAHREALDIWRRRDEPAKTAWALSQLAQDYRGALQFDDALQCSLEAIALLEAQGAEDRVASLWGGVGENLRRMGRGDDAIDAYLKAEDIWRARGDATAQAWVLGGIGLARRDVGRPREAIQSHRQALDILEGAPKGRFSAALNHGWIAACLRQLQDYPPSLEHDQIALGLWRDLDNRRHVVNSLASIALTRLRQGDFAAAVPVGEEAFASALRDNYQAQIIGSAGLLAHLHVRLGQTSRIWKFLDDSGVRDVRRLSETVLAQAGSALAWVEAQDGRAVAFGRGVELLEGLQARSELAPFSENATYLLSGLLEAGSAFALLRDLAEEAAAENRLLPSRRDAIELATRYLEAGRDNALLEQADPDVGDAVRTIINAIEHRAKRAD